MERDIWDIQEKDELYTQGINIADRVSNVIPTVRVSTKVGLHFLFLQNGIIRLGVWSYYFIQYF
jgi:hypothetical protein